MASPDHWTVPAALRPKPADYAYDLDRALAAVVSLSAQVPPDAFTAEVLGTERAGNGVLIRDDGLVLTIGYLIAEAESVWLTTGAGRVVPAHALAYDYVSGFGLVQALGRLDIPALPLGDSDRLAVQDPAGVGGAGGGGRSRPASWRARSSPAIGNMCWTRRCSRPRRIRTGVARRSSGLRAIFSGSARCSSSKPSGTGTQWTST